MNTEAKAANSDRSAVLDYVARHRRTLLVVMLALLHITLMQGITGFLGRTLLVAHFGIFLLWQPFVQAGARVPARQLGGMIAVLALTVTFLSWWLMILWLMLLAGIVGGRIFFFHSQKAKVFYLLALIYLMAVLLVFAVPQIIPRPQESVGPFIALARYGFPMLIAAMALIPAGGTNDSPTEAIDLAYSLFVILLLAVLVLGSVALMLLEGVGYIQALLIMVFAGAAMLMLLSFAWNPSAGFSGLGAMASRYLLAVGLPLEQWLHGITALAQREPDPIHFLDQACREMVARLSWIGGGVWRTEGKEGRFGGSGGVETTFSQNKLVLTLYTQQPMPPALIWHFNLVAQLLAELHRAKHQAQQLRDMAYMQAIHETGARLTHDVKNLLQSINTLIFAANIDKRDSSAQYRRLLDRQLPQISLRLQQTMDKLVQPELEQSEMVMAADWWHQMEERYAVEGVLFESRGELGVAKLPAELFTTAAENLLQNAMNKRTVNADIEIRITLDVELPPVRIWVCDSGAELAGDLAADIGKRPVASETGLGIGLYQVARNAHLYGYRLELVVNRPGNVCVGLVPES